ncbi:ABC transporter substrate-binding protein [uncultured Fusobacterium sp.]|uniref:ABC transporter substrate-binding protein n=1 Tax=uncultured Fusobacterium sp. TaxID=159267 RepID=UPI0025F7AEF6|nr:ABC transporter substrate-binding protein [uncultured Fusobacterium sp.]
MKKINMFVVGAMMLIGGCGKSGEVAKPETIKIGGMAPLTGALAIYGVTTTNGAELAVKEINENGGILGKKIEYIMLDTKGDSTEAVMAYNKLVDEKVAGIIGEVTSKPTLAVAEVAVQDNMPLITPTGTQVDITEAGPNVFRVCFTNPYQGKVLAITSKERLGADTVAVMLNNSSDYSDGITKAFIEESEKLGMKVMGVEGYSDGDKDFRPQLTKLAAMNPDVVLIPEYYEQAALIATQAREVGVKSIFVGSDGWDGIAKTLDKSSYSAIENSYFTNHFSMEDQSEKIQNFLKDYRETYKEDPSAFSALGYDAIYMMKSAIEKAGTTDKQKVVDALKGIEYDGITGYLTFDDHNNPVKAVTVLKIENGKYIFDSKVK